MENTGYENAVRKLRRDFVPADQRLEERAGPAAKTARFITLEVDADDRTVQRRRRSLATRAGAASGDRGAIAGAPARSHGEERPGGTARGRGRPARESSAPVAQGSIT